MLLKKTKAILSFFEIRHFIRSLISLINLRFFWRISDAASYLFFF